MAKQDSDRYRMTQRALGLSLGVGPKVVQGVGTYNARHVMSIQCDIDSDYSATYLDGTTLASQTRAQNSVRGGIFTDDGFAVVCCRHPVKTAVEINYRPGPGQGNREQAEVKNHDQIEV